ncbi:MAG: hypothetical protein HYS07_04670 [Chlamydiae bacterium]|nr:hypothetical protein [Chlamydiota bacterium]MBI3276183.1 hypothetical protein [Chlamydiota bacterium]
MRFKIFLFAFIITLVTFGILSPVSQFVSSSEAAPPVATGGQEAPVIQYFSGEIIIYYKDGTTITLHTGDQAPALQPGTVIYVKEGALALNVNNDVANFKTGETVRITQNENGNWVAISSNTQSSGASNTSLATPDNADSESEIVTEEEETPETEAPTEVSPS